MSSTELAVRQATISVDDLGRIAKMLALSGYFGSDQNLDVAVAQMATRVLAGHEMGFGPFASATGVYIIKGKPVLAAGLLAAAVKASGKYDYRVRQNDASAVTIEFFQRQGAGWESLGVSTFTAEDAKTAQLSGKDNWKTFPRNMLFARAMSNGVRWYCPDVFAGNLVYTPDELGAEVDGETGEIIEATARPIPDRSNETAHKNNVSAQPHPEQDMGMGAEPTPTNGNGGRKVEHAGQAQLNRLHALGTQLYGSDWDAKRHVMAEKVSKGATKSSKELTPGEVEKLIAGMEKKLAEQVDAAPTIHGPDDDPFDEAGK